MQELENYIRSNRAQGMDETMIKQNLRTSGWDEASINQAWTAVNQGHAPLPSLPGEGQSPTKILGSRKFLAKGIAAFIVLTVLAAGGWFAYSQYASNPERIWKVALEKAKNLNSGHFKLEGSYTETPPENPPEEYKNSFGSLGKITLSLTGEGNFMVNKDGQTNFTLNSNLTSKYGAITLWH